jgi:uncharacterized protein YodC (DUF2158 family)
MSTPNPARPDGAAPESIRVGPAVQGERNPNPDVGCPFSKGDTVRHRLGGPVMTVEAIDPPFFFFRVRCSWVDGTELRSQQFRAEDLEHVPQE